MVIVECQFADDAAVVRETRESIERAAHALATVTSEWGLTMSFPKTKLFVAGARCGVEDLQPINIRGETIEAVLSFRYLGSILESHGEILIDVEDRVASVLCAFGALCRSVFHDGGLSLRTKRMVLLSYCSVRSMEQKHGQASRAPYRRLRLQILGES